MGFIRWLGWAVNAGLLIAFAQGVAGHLSDRFSVGFHMRFGLALLLGYLLLHILPYFCLVGRVGRLRAATSRDEDSERRVDLAVRAKAGLFWPTILALLAGLAGPVVGVLQVADRVPPYTHGMLMAAAGIVHVRVWARALFSLDIADRLVHDAEL